MSTVLISNLFLISHVYKHLQEQSNIRKNNWAASWQNPTKWHMHPAKTHQPGHPPSLIRVFAVRIKKAWVLSYPLNAQRRLIRQGGCPGWPESLLGAQIILLVLSWGGSIVTYTKNQENWNILTILSFRIDRSGKTAQIPIRLLKEQSAP